MSIFYSKGWDEFLAIHQKKLSKRWQVAFDLLQEKQAPIPGTRYAFMRNNKYYSTIDWKDNLDDAELYTSLMHARFSKHFVCNVWNNIPEDEVKIIAVCLLQFCIIE